MVATSEEIKIVEDFLKGRSLPGTFKLNSATTIFSLRTYIKNYIEGVKGGQMTDLVAGARWEDVCKVKSMIEDEEAGKLSRP